MRFLVFILTLLALPATAEESAVQIVNGIRIIDATKLSVAELMALADEERQTATRAQCCDWGGGGCDAAAALAERSARERLLAAGN